VFTDCVEEIEIDEDAIRRFAAGFSKYVHTCYLYGATRVLVSLFSID
jgi:hypothetical protein